MKSKKNNIKLIYIDQILQLIQKINNLLNLKYKKLKKLEIFHLLIICQRNLTLWSLDSVKVLLIKENNKLVVIIVKAKLNTL